MTSKSEKQNTEFDQFRRENPGATYSDFYARVLMARVKDGSGKNAVGVGYAALSNGDIEAFWSVARDKIARQLKKLGAQPHHKIVDYGCGALRMGCHYIKFLDKGHYFGVDITDEFYEVGLKLLGPQLVAEKAPRLAVISPEANREAADFKPDFVMANAVAFHIHPDEGDGFLNTLQQITSKPQAILSFDVKLAKKPAQLSDRAWAFPLSYYEANLPRLRNVSQKRALQIALDSLDEERSVNFRLMFARD